MKAINLKSLINIYLGNGGILPKEYINFIGEDYGLEVKKYELDVLKSLIEYIEENNMISLNEYNYFYLGYKIPQIGKEFDLLRFDDENILNIEYKREVSDISILKEQLIKNKYYLQFLMKGITLIGYIQRNNELYILRENNELEILSINEIIKILSNNEKCMELDLNNIFKASNYLISPFNKTEQFIKDQYFLTKHQEEIMKEIMKDINKGRKLFLIQGDAGTGKTLLTYHLAKELKRKNNNVALIHCAQINNGQYKLINNYKWNIYPIKSYSSLFEKRFDVLIIDEVQRIKIEQFRLIKKYIDDNVTLLILSGDRKQILRNGEGGIIEILENEQLKKFSMTKKIRTNKELADFISVMLDLTKLNDNKLTKKNINIVYFTSYEEADKYIKTKQNYSFINYTSTLYPENGQVGFERIDYNRNTVGNPHKVIGQEFENVGVLIDKHFYYDNNKLKAHTMYNNVYSPKDMLYQAITRVIQTLEIIVVENIEVFNILINIFDKE